MKKIILGFGLLSVMVIVSGCGQPTNVTNNPVVSKPPQAPLTTNVAIPGNPNTNIPTTTNSTVPPTGANPNISTPPAPPVVKPVPAKPPVTVSAPITQKITIQNFAFNPAALSIKVGDSVTWTNTDPIAHQIQSATFNSDPLDSGQSFTYKFTAAGTYNYNCKIHPSMTGQIIVQ